MKHNVLTTKNLVLIAILSSLAAFLMWFEFPLFVAPASMYGMDLSELCALVGGYIIGPWASVIIEVLKIMIKLIIKPTSTMFVGEMANLIVGIAMVYPAAKIFHLRKDRKMMFFGLVIGTISMCIVGGVFNYYVALPFFSSLYGLPIDDIVAMGAMIFPLVDSSFMFVLVCVSLFNVIKGLILSIVMILMYQNIYAICKRF